MENKIQELTDKIYREGVEKGNTEAQKLIANAQDCLLYTSRICLKVLTFASAFWKEKAIQKEAIFE